MGFASLQGMLQDINIIVGKLFSLCKNSSCSHLSCGYKLTNVSDFSSDCRCEELLIAAKSLTNHERSLQSQLLQSKSVSM